MAEHFDVIVVGAGPSGIAAAHLLAKAGVSVLVIERGDYPGSKNVMGGVLYRHATDQVIPGFWKEAPLERPVVETRLWVLEKDSAITVGYRSPKFGQEPYNSFTVLRAKFDKWFAKKAEEAGALIITETVAEELIMKDGKVIGVRTDRENGEVYADVVIVADGVNSLLAKKAGLHGEIPPANVALAVKEIIALPKEKIEDRFNLEPGQGATIELVGEATAGMFGTAFIYTNQDTLSVGVGAILSDLIRRQVKPYELIEHLKAHPMVKPLLAGGETREYLGHLIPEGGYHAVPPLYGDGFLIVGDAAMLVNSLHREGSNMAMSSGRLAAETVLEARQKGDFSKRTLAAYQRKLEESYVLKDLKKYRHAGRFFETHPHIFELYPELANSAAYEFLKVDGIPKREKQRTIIRNATARRPLRKMIGDAYAAWRALR
ncbi:MAG: FAD-dependent oxidoreductase [Firmicutes bacterium]|nr:FAD-dependent oxidoreductase [Bacillota bacterium]